MSSYKLGIRSRSYVLFNLSAIMWFKGTVNVIYNLIKRTDILIIQIYVVTDSTIKS